MNGRSPVGCRCSRCGRSAAVGAAGPRRVASPGWDGKQAASSTVAARPAPAARQPSQPLHPAASASAPNVAIHPCPPASPRTHPSSHTPPSRLVPHPVLLSACALAFPANRCTLNSLWRPQPASPPPKPYPSLSPCRPTPLSTRALSPSALPCSLLLHLYSYPPSCSPVA